MTQGKHAQTREARAARHNEAAGASSNWILTDNTSRLSEEGGAESNDTHEEAGLGRQSTSSADRDESCGGLRRNRVGSGG